MTLQAKFFAFVAPVLLATATVPPVIWYCQLQVTPSFNLVACEAIVIGGVVIVSALLSVYFAASRLVCRPMRRMAGEMGRISAGQQQLRPLPEAARRDELGMAARAFNEVVDAVQWTSTALRAANTELERRVEKRTAELARRNEQIQSTEQKYRSIFENATEGIFQTSPEGHPIAANPAMVRMLGYESEEQLMASITNVGQQVYADNKARQELMDQLILSGVVEQFEAEFLRRDQSRIWISMAARAVRDESGKLLHFEGFIRNITQQKQARMEQLRSEAEARKLALIASRTHNPVLITDSKGRIEWANAAFSKLTGYALTEMVGLKPGSLLQGPDTDPATVAQMRACVDAGLPFQVEMVNYSRWGRKYWLAIDAEPVKNESGKVEHFIALEEDITERKRAEWMDKDRRLLLEMTARNGALPNTLKAVCDAAERQREQSRAMVLLYENGRRYVAAAPQLSEAFTAAIDESLRQNDPSQNDGPFDGISRFVADISVCESWKSLSTAAGSEDILACRSTQIVAGNGNLLGEFVLFDRKRVSTDNHQLDTVQSLAGLAGLAIEHHQLTTRLEYEAVHDPLTLLPNRAKLERELPQWISSAARQHRMLGVLMIDLDGFKHVNDTLGHPAGDELLRQAAVRLAEATRNSDVLVRTGGDEFTLVATEIKAVGDVAIVADRLLRSLSAPFDLEGRELFVTASIGTAVFPNDGTDAASLQRSADAAMYAAKAGGRNRSHTFDPQMRAAALELFEMESKLRHAVDNDELFLEYQPQVNCNGQITGVEALLRWEHPKLGRVAPARFIPLAEQSGLIVSIGKWVLYQACRQARAWQNAGCKPVSVAVNVSSLQFQQPDFLQIVAAVLAETGLEPQYLELELTETLLMTNTAEAIEKVAAVREMGIGVAIDDFGTGYSSLAYLQKLPIDRLKIDQSFVRELGEGDITTMDSSRTTIITAITSLATSLGKGVVAEGVETTDQRDYLISIGCGTLQGYLFGRPMAAQHITSMLESRNESESVAIAA